MLLSVSLLGHAQKGSLFLTHFQESRPANLQNWSIAQDSSNNMFFANRKGILKFNGQDWKLIKTPVIPFTLYHHSQEKKIFVGADQDIGHLSRDEKGFYHYKSLTSEVSTPGEFITIEQVDSVLYFMSTRMMIRMDPQDPGKRKLWEAKADHPFTGLMHNKEDVFVNQWKKGLHRLQGDTLFPIVSGFWTTNKEILFHLPYSEDRILVGTDNSELYLFDGMKFYEFHINNSSYLRESILAGAQNISARYFALSTLAGGVLVVDKYNREVEYTINYQTGLPDDEIQALALDSNQGLWISHSYGVSRADLSLPIKKFSTYPGIEGNLLNSIEVDNTLYLGTGAGLFRLAREKKYREQEITVRVEREVPVATVPEPQPDIHPIQELRDTTKQEPEEPQKLQTKEQKEQPGAFKRFFNKIFGKKKDPQDKREKPSREQLKPEAEPTAGSTSPSKSEKAARSQEAAKETQVSYQKKKIYSLQSISHRFKKIEGIEGKVKHLIPFEGGLLAGTQDGVYHIRGENRINRVISDITPQQIIPFREGRSVLMATLSGIKQATYTHGQWKTRDYLPDISEPLYSLVFNERTGNLWAGGEDKAYKIEFNLDGDIASLQAYSLSTEYSEKYLARNIDQHLHIFISSGIHQYQAASDSFVSLPAFQRDSLILSHYRYVLSQNDVSWAKKQNQWEMLGNHPGWNDSLSRFLNLFENIQNISLSPSNHMWIITGNELYRIALDEGLPVENNFKAFFTAIQADKNYSFKHSNLDIQKENTALRFEIAAPQYIKKGSNQYQYKIEGLMEDWSEYSSDPTIRIFARKGEYTVRARARNIWGQVSETGKIHYEVPPPFTETHTFYGMIVIATGGLLLMTIKLRERKLKHDKRLLEEAVRQRTATIEEQKGEIAHQRDEILQQKNTIEKKNEEITGSIEYASRIQNHLLPKKEQFEQAFSEYFILFKPKSIVSGDFYWIHTQEDKIFVTAADCTGHGVPGAFMSMLGISSLNEIAGNPRNHHSNAAEIVNQLRDAVKNSLNQTGKKDHTRDGMDIAFCAIDKKNMKMDYAGAFNPLYLFQKNTFKKYEPDRMPVGAYRTDRDSFTNHQIDIHPGDTLYLFSDGYIDQLGGPGHKKFRSQNFISLLHNIHVRPMTEQREILEKKFSEWKGSNFQVDDVVVLGLKI